MPLSRERADRQLMSTTQVRHARHIEMGRIPSEPSPCLAGVSRILGAESVEQVAFLLSDHEPVERKDDKWKQHDRSEFRPS